MSCFELLYGTEEGLVGGSDSRTELSTDALSETRGTQAADQLSGVLLTPGGIQGLVLERGALFKQKEVNKIR